MCGQGDGAPNWPKNLLSMSVHLKKVMEQLQRTLRLACNNDLQLLMDTPSPNAEDSLA